MATSPPTTPGGKLTPRPLSAMVRPAPRSISRLSMSCKTGGGSRASDEDGRTSVRVAVRVRPALQPTDPGLELIPQRFQRPIVHVQSDTSLVIDSSQGRKLFVFDRVFGPDVEQAGIWDYLQDCIIAFTQGYNVSLLAYGQSGAGKSYTMGTSGPHHKDDYEVMGVVPRAAHALFEKLEGPRESQNPGSMTQLRAPASSYSRQMPRGKKNWTLKATYVEIYNEQLRDLLVPEHVPIHERPAVAIREDVRGNILLTSLTQIDINSAEDLLNALIYGSTLRQTDETAINARSSRSHAVFSLNLVQRRSKMEAAQADNKRFSMPVESMSGSEAWITTDSKMHFVDLAGSERLKNTGAQGERAKEGIAINAGLAALGKVIAQLSSRQPGAHVSYRDSKLTRMLQDSLGGNAITYMIACVTPPEFHLGETLNTVQYAQRARAIQTKPRIQSVEESDKQAIIERLKAEVAFLREQIRSAERSGGERRAPAATNDQFEHQTGREAELQNQLLDAQENYTTLSQRHAKLIAEMAKARDGEAAENHTLEDMMGDSATARLKRSSSFAQAVEQVVLEYEKTIQTLEQSLSNTRATLANTDTTLLETETKSHYMETINTQLQARLQKLMDRETNMEKYLHDLESKLDGHTSGEEKNAAIVVELRKELARVRENEASCEDYISTLEEKLAEADQDSELMQREIDRLEQFIERQRSLGKLDSLLYELDNIQQVCEVPEPESEPANGMGHRRAFSRNLANRSRSQSDASHGHGTHEDKFPDGATTFGTETITAEDMAAAAKGEMGAAIPKASRTASEEMADPAQSRLVADQLETVSRELTDLRVEHENIMTEHEMLQAKYEEALRAMAEMQDAMDETRHLGRQRDSVLSVASPERPPSFLSDARSSITKDGTRLSSSRSLSSELFSAMESPATMVTSDADTAVPHSESQHTVTEELAGENRIVTELHRFNRMTEQKEATENDLFSRYADLQHKHNEALDLVEELKTEIAKAQAASNEAMSPRGNTPVIRRKSSQNVMTIDRAHRSFASLRNIAAETFENNPDVMQNFELNLHAAMHELYARSERIQELEADVATAKKEMDTKMTIISGLTRERSSLKASAMDMATISNLREQLEKTEKQKEQLRESHTAREAELESQLSELRAFTKVGETSEKTNTASSEKLEAQEKKIASLEAELTAWEFKHRSSLESMHAAESETNKTIQERGSPTASGTAQPAGEHMRQVDEEAETKHKKLVEFLRTEIDEYKYLININQAKMANVESQDATAKAMLEVACQDLDAAVEEIETHKQLVHRLERQIADHEKAIKDHDEHLQALEANHALDLEEIKASSQQEIGSRLASLLSEHDETVKLLESDLTDAREELMKVATQVSFGLGLDVSVEKITDRIDLLLSGQQVLAVEQNKRRELEATVLELSTVNDKIMRDLDSTKTALAGVLVVDGDISKSPYSTVVEQVAAIKKKMTELEQRNKNNLRLVEELEDQLQSNYDQVQLSNNRMSTLQTERQAQLDEANNARNRLQAELDALREEYAALQSMRKTGSVQSLPSSPPPAIPLPPLPGNSMSATAPVSPPGRPASKDNAALAQIHQDQEARIFTITKHLEAEKQLTATLEEALTDLEVQQKKIKADMDAWRRRAGELESELKVLKQRPQQDNRWSMQQVEEERKKRRDAEIAAQRLEERMNTISSKKKKKGSLNCF